MTTYVALLRGINVSGHRPVPMQKLAATCTALGLGSVVTYLQSGNVVADADDDDAAGLRLRLEAAIHEAFGFPVVVLLRTAQQLEAVVASNPFAAAAADNPKLVHVTFLSELPAPDTVARLQTRSFEPDAIHVVGSEAYLHCPGGYGRTKLSNPFLERALAVCATTRNWATVTRLAAMAGERRR
ncbi:MAG: DUF1697 domain-containing protein [Thermoanaerobaculaceae bacterium]|jgi:uncharacterized protein (DUF1697 family)|nr:DUF1697 domain-containing protein [Thermoanaerobaculaceae bacterium]